ncbi:type IV toxin-antitoxin system AbiEi family antitoxin domain-containing protein [Piscicoccus intestinalis]|uniref:type IV toxin-antitoxin system AbiEi family antitoxin domain-containing protein n=1 Tax=Piscicoccus intestinalis TaxID=746033 RepID=UPI0008395757|nr:type IV toxin-antitoxin system AbiEi family antitoxin domain-containing protein [Piscicoccus intestinalis]
MDQLHDFRQFLAARTGVLTRAQAQAHGFSDDVVAAAIKAGLLTRVMRGCYASLAGEARRRSVTASGHGPWRRGWAVSWWPVTTPP